MPWRDWERHGYRDIDAKQAHVTSASASTIPGHIALLPHMAICIACLYRPQAMTCISSTWPLRQNAHGLSPKAALSCLKSSSSLYNSIAQRSCTKMYILLHLCWAAAPFASSVGEASIPVAFVASARRVDRSRAIYGRLKGRRWSKMVQLELAPLFLRSSRVTYAMDRWYVSRAVQCSSMKTYVGLL